jgi:hypothetical protein
VTSIAEDDATDELGTFPLKVALGEGCRDAGEEEVANTVLDSGSRLFASRRAAISLSLVLGDLSFLSAVSAVVVVEELVDRFAEDALGAAWGGACEGSLC